MIPYRKATDSLIKQHERPAKLLKTAASIGLTGAGAALASKALPFLSEYIPSELAMKGLSKVSPKLGKFVQEGLSLGKSFDEIKEFVGSQLSPALQNEQEQKPNILQQYSPELFGFIQEEVKKGRTPMQGAGLAKLSGKFGQVIKQMENDHKMPYSSIIESVFGEEEPQQPSQPQQQMAQGNGDEALMAAIQKIMQM